MKLRAAEGPLRNITRSEFKLREQSAEDALNRGRIRTEVVQGVVIRELGHCSAKRIPELRTTVHRAGAWRSRTITTTTVLWRGWHTGEQAVNGIRLAVPGELLGLARGVFSKGAAKFRFLEQQGKRTGKGTWISWVRKKNSVHTVCNIFADAGKTADEHRQAAGHGLQNGQIE